MKKRLDTPVPFCIAKILKKLKYNYPGSMVYSKDGVLMWIGGFRKQIDLLTDENLTSAPTWRYLLTRK